MFFLNKHDNDNIKGLTAEVRREALLSAWELAGVTISELRADSRVKIKGSGLQTASNSPWKLLIFGKFGANKSINKIQIFQLSWSYYFVDFICFHWVPPTPSIQTDAYQMKKKLNFH